MRATETSSDPAPSGVGIHRPDSEGKLPDGDDASGHLGRCRGDHAEQAGGGPSPGLQRPPDTHLDHREGACHPKTEDSMPA